MSRSLHIISHGLQSSIQDRGREDYRRYGVPLSGAMDRLSADMANALLGNDLNAALIEMMSVGGEFQFMCSTHITLSGADYSPRLNRKRIKYYKPYQVVKGDILSFGRPKFGRCCYLSVKGGINSRKLLGSRSHMSGITSYARLHQGRALDITPYQESLSPSNANVIIDQRHFTNSAIQVLPGPEYEDEHKLIEKLAFTIDNSSNRMAYQFEERVDFSTSTASMLTSSVQPGTVQLTPSGELVVLMRDCQTTGGYPRIFQLPESSINQLAQKREREVIQFKVIS